MDIISNVCKTVAEVKVATDKLDKTSLVPIKIDDGGVIKDVDNFRGIYNISQGKFCTSVVPHYNLVQHKQYFDGFADALNRLNIPFTMQMKQVGNKAFADIEFIGRNIKYDKLGEEFTTGIRLINSCDKTTGLHVVPKYTRLACSNGMIITRTEKSLSIRHHSKIVTEIERFIELKVNSIINDNNDLKMWVSSSMEDSIEWDTACKIMAELFKQIKHREEVLKRLGISVITVKDKKTKKKNISYVWDSEDAKKDKLTRWELYNAITSYLTHGEHMTPFIENLFHKQAETLLVTPLIKMPYKKGL